VPRRCPAAGHYIELKKRKTKVHRSFKVDGGGALWGRKKREFQEVPLSAPPWGSGAAGHFWTEKINRL